jgi:hypothetical protein
MKLSQNFTKKEATDWAVHQVMTPKDKQLAIDLARLAMEDPKVLQNAVRISEKLQAIRAAVNAQFPKYGGKIGLRPLSWVRAKEWELKRGRSGLSQHVTGHAVDFIAVNITPADYSAVMEWLWLHLQGWNGGLARLYKNNRWSFIHIDLGRKRRWEY